jgi:translation initiation factor 2-alpha kinase 1
VVGTSRDRARETMPPPPRIREVRDSDDEEEGDDDLADFAFEKGTGIVGADRLARVSSAFAEGSGFDARGADESKAAGSSGGFGDDPGVAATMAVARIMSATGSKTLPPGLVRLMSPYQAHYDELKLLGKGGFGSVVAAVGRLDDRPVAVKKVHFKSAAPPWAKNDTLESLHEELLREARALALMDNIRVVKYHAAWIEPRWEKLAAMEGGTPAGDGRSSIAAGDGAFDFASAKGMGSGMGNRRPSLMFANEFDSGSGSDSSEEDESTSSASCVDTNADSASAENTRNSLDLQNLLTDLSVGGGDKKVLQKVWTSPVKARRKQKSSFSNNNQKPRWPYTLYIAMELCPGTTLRDWIRVRPKGDIQAGAGTHIFRSTVEALRYIHSFGIIHRDVKPANILVHRGSSELEPTVKLMDFGLAVFDTGETSDRDDVIYEDGFQKGKKFSVGVGTASYCAPEQRAGAGVYTSSVDMYSVGVILVEMLCALGAEATESERARLIAAAKQLELPESLTKSFPKHAALARELLATDPTERPTTAAVLRRWPRVNMRAEERFGEKQSAAAGMHARLLSGGGGSFPNGVGASARQNIGVAVAAAAGAAAAKVAAGGATGDSGYVPPGYGEPRASSVEIEAAAMSAALNQFNIKRSQSLPEAELAAIADAVAAAGEIAALGGARSPNSPVRRAASPMLPASVPEETEEEDTKESTSRDEMEAEIKRLRERVAELERR